LEFIDKARRVAELAQEKNAENVVLLHVTELCSYTDAIVICHGRSTRQVQTIIQHIRTEMKQAGEQPFASEGELEGMWALIDFGDVLVHVFFESMRPYYDLEGIYPDAPQIDITSTAAQV